VFYFFNNFDIIIVKRVMQKKKTKTFDPVMTVDNYLGYPEDVDK